MSYVLYPNLVAIEKLAPIVGCKDKNLIEAIKARDPEEYEDDDEWDVEEEGEVSLGMAIDDLILGNETHADSAHQYGYALAEICTLKGTDILAEKWGGVRWGAIEECGLVDLMTNTGPPIPLPENNGFPRIGHIKRTDLQEYIDIANQLKSEKSDSEILELIDEYIGWLNLANDKQSDIVFFYY